MVEGCKGSFVDSEPIVTLDKIHRRDPEAIAELVRLHQRQLRGYVAALSADVGVVDDLAQEVFVRALRRLDCVVDREDFGRFLRGIARNVVREHARWRTRYQERYIAFVDEAYAATEAAPAPTADVSPRLRDALRGCVEKWPARSQRMLRLLIPAQPVQGSTLIEQLVDWNLSLSEAPSPAERSRIYQARQASLQTIVTKTELPADERELATLLLQTGAWLAEHDDPIGQAEHFSVVADTLADRVRAVTAQQDVAAAQRFAVLHRVVVVRGVAGSLQRAEAPPKTGGPSDTGKVPTPKPTPPNIQPVVKPTLSVRVVEIKPGQDIPQILIQRDADTVTVISRHEDGRFTARYQGGPPYIAIVGQVVERKVQVSEITIVDGDSETRYSSEDKVPALFRERVQKLIERSAKEPIKTRVRTIITTIP